MGINLSGRTAVRPFIFGRSHQDCYRKIAFLQNNNLSLLHDNQERNETKIGLFAFTAQTPGCAIQAGHFRGFHGYVQVELVAYVNDIRDEVFLIFFALKFGASHEEKSYIVYAPGNCTDIDKPPYTHKIFLRFEALSRLRRSGEDMAL